MLLLGKILTLLWKILTLLWEIVSYATSAIMAILFIAAIISCCVDEKFFDADSDRPSLQLDRNSQTSNSHSLNNVPEQQVDNDKIDNEDEYISQLIKNVPDISRALHIIINESQRSAPNNYQDGQITLYTNDYEIRVMKGRLRAIITDLSIDNLEQLSKKIDQRAAVTENNEAGASVQEFSGILFLGKFGIRVDSTRAAKQTINVEFSQADLASVSIHVFESADAGFIKTLKSFVKSGKAAIPPPRRGIAISQSTEITVIGLLERIDIEGPSGNASQVINILSQTGKSAAKQEFEHLIEQPLITAVPLASQIQSETKNPTALRSGLKSELRPRPRVIMPMIRNVLRILRIGIRRSIRNSRR